MFKSRINPLNLYLIAVGSWFAGYGIQNVMFAWIITIVLQETPAKLGIAQMTLVLPATLFMLIGGSLADRWSPKRVAFMAHTTSVILPLFIVFGLLIDTLNYTWMIVYAVGMGFVQAFLFPSRDAILNHVARGGIQRTVVKGTLAQFLSQMFGIALAGLAQYIGGTPIVLGQALVLAVGAGGLSRIPLKRKEEKTLTQPLLPSVFKSIKTGFNTVMKDRVMRAVVVQNFGMGICFMGSYLVTIPILVRDVFNGSSLDLAIVNFLNSTGLVLMTLILLFGVGRLKRQGRSLQISQSVGAVFLSISGLAGISFVQFCLLLFFWGMCGGVALSMCRAIMQERAEESQRAQILSFFSFSFFGSSPLGALVWGFLIEVIGPHATLITASLSMLALATLISIKTPLWRA